MIYRMRQCLFFATIFLLTACNRISAFELRGEWTVESITVRESYLGEVSGWESSYAAANVFIVGESMTFAPVYIYPCPTANSELGMYMDYNGRRRYKYFLGKITIFKADYSYQYVDETTFETGSISLREFNFDVFSLNNRRIVLTEKYTEPQGSDGSVREMHTEVVLTR